MDRLLRYHDTRRPRLLRYVSWLGNAVFFPERGRFTLFVSEGPHVPLAMMRLLRLLRPDQRIAALMASEALYFLATHVYSRLTESALLSVLGAFDGLLCVGEMQADLARLVLPARRLRLFTIPGAIPEARVQSLKRVRPALDSPNLVFIANGPSGWRIRYKGLDLLLAAFERLLVIRPEARLTVLGEWTSQAAAAALSRMSAGQERVTFAGSRHDIGSDLARASLCVHLGRGDAFPIATLEAMYAGVPTIVSEWTGTREVVRKVQPSFVVPLDAETAATAIDRYLEYPVASRQALASRFRDAAAAYTEAQAILRFKTAVAELARSLA